MKNSIYVIHPYKIGGRGNWVFDDPTKSLEAEPFVMGINEIIDIMLEFANMDYKDSVRGFQLLFSESPFVGHTLSLKFSHTEMNGSWYIAPTLNMRGWLCPALFKYFRTAPKNLYVQVNPL